MEKNNAGWNSGWLHRFGKKPFVSGIVITGILLVSQMISYKWYWSTTETVQRVMKDMVHFTIPGAQMRGGSTSGGFFLAMDAQYTIEEQVGRKMQPIGKIENKVRFTLPNVKLKWNNGQYPILLYFAYPQTDNTKPDATRVNRAGWSTLEKLPEGTVAQMAISFTRLATHDEYFKMIQKYDVDTVWFAVATGQEQDSRSGVRKKGEVWGYSVRELDYGNQIMVHGEGDRRATTYIDEMEYLLAQRKWSQRIGEQLMGDPKIESRYNYLKKHGVTLYGAVVTGPTKELLKLRQEPMLTAPYIGKIDWWNWDQPSASGSEISY